MPTATLTFNLSDEEDTERFQMATDAVNYRLALIDVANRLRATDKYDQEPMTSEEFYDFLNNRGISKLF